MNDYDVDDYDDEVADDSMIKVITGNIGAPPSAGLKVSYRVGLSPTHKYTCEECLQWGTVKTKSYLGQTQLTNSDPSAQNALSGVLQICKY